MDNETLKNILLECDVSLYDTEIVSENDRRIYRIYITAKDGVSLEKCTKVTKIISPILDVNPPANGEYFLEVSSPGIERSLKKLEHFKNSIGELVKFKLTDLTKPKGKLIKVEDNLITIQANQNEEIIIKYEDILKARTYFEW